MRPEALTLEGVVCSAKGASRVSLAAPAAQGGPLHAAADSSRAALARWDRTEGAVPVFRLVRFPGPSPEPDVRLPPHPALYEPVPLGYVASIVWPLHGVGIAAPR
jgi:hypothetical protein